MVRLDRRDRVQQIDTIHTNAKTPPRPSRWSVVGVPLLLLLLLLVTPWSAATARAQDKTRQVYQKAEAFHRKILADDTSKKRRDKWEACAEKYLDVWRQDPEGIWAPAGLYQAGKLYMVLQVYSRKENDLDRAREYLTKASTFGASRYSLEATKLLARLPKGAEHAAQKEKPSPEVKTAATRKTDKPVTRPTAAPEEATTGGSITHIRYGTLPSRTRIVLDTKGALAFNHGILRQDAKTEKPKRIWIDIEGDAEKTLEPSLSLDNDPRVSQIRSSLYKPGTVRVVVDTNSFSHYKVFPLSNPHRIVVDIWNETSPASDNDPDGEETAAAAPAAAVPVKRPAGKSAPAEEINEEITPHDLARQLALGVQCIVIDAGHGGKDHGAPGYDDGVAEKDIVLTLAKQIATKLRKEIKCEVILTRSSDEFLTLDERTTIANKKRADLFISIHANASRNRDANGVETYFLNLAKDQDSINVAARENATSEKNISDLHTILNSLMKNAKINESSRLAQYVQNSLISDLSNSHGTVLDKGVKQAPFYVLLGARMPAILVETGFISNKVECKRLSSPDYQETICDGIVKGVKSYIHSTHPSSLARKNN